MMIRKSKQKQLARIQSAECIGYNKGYNKALEEVYQLLNKLRNNIWLDNRTFEGIKCKTCIPLDYMDEYFEDFKQQLTQMKEKEL